MSEWIVSAASSAVSPSRSVHARVSFSPAVKNVISDERVAQPAHDLLQRRRAAVAERGGLLLVELGQLGLEREVDPARAVLDREHRLRRQRLELARQLARVLGERRPGVDVREHLAELLDLDAQLRVARLRLLLDALQPLLDVVAVGDEQLQLQVLEVARRIGVGREAVDDDEQRVHLAQVPEQRRAGAGHVLHADRRGRDLLRRDDLRQRVEPLVRDLGHADVRLAVLAAAGLGQRREERRLPRAGQAHDSHLERHARSLPPSGVSSRR